MTVAPVSDLNAWAILRSRSILMTRGAIEAFRASAAAANKPAATPRKKPARKASARVAKKEAK